MPAELDELNRRMIASCEIEREALKKEKDAGQPGAPGSSWRRSWPTCTSSAAP